MGCGGVDKQGERGVVGLPGRCPIWMQVSHARGRLLWGTGAAGPAQSSMPCFQGLRPRVPGGRWGCTALAATGALRHAGRANRAGCEHPLRRRMRVHHSCSCCLYSLSLHTGLLLPTAPPSKPRAACKTAQNNVVPPLSAIVGVHTWQPSPHAVPSVKSFKWMPSHRLACEAGCHART